MFPQWLLPFLVLLCHGVTQVLTTANLQKRDDLSDNNLVLDTGTILTGNLTCTGNATIISFSFLGLNSSKSAYAISISNKLSPIDDGAFKLTQSSFISTTCSTSETIRLSPTAQYMTNSSIPSCRAIFGKFVLQTPLAEKCSNRATPTSVKASLFYIKTGSSGLSLGTKVKSMSSIICNPDEDSYCLLSDLANHLPLPQWSGKNYSKEVTKFQSLFVVPLGLAGTTADLQAKTNDPLNFGKFQNNFGKYFNALGTNGLLDIQSLQDYYLEVFNNNSYYRKVSDYSTYLGGTQVLPVVEKPYFNVKDAVCDFTSYIPRALAKIKNPYYSWMWDYMAKQNCDSKPALPATNLNHVRVYPLDYSFFIPMGRDINITETELNNFLRAQVTKYKQAFIDADIGFQTILAIHLADNFNVVAANGETTCYDICGFHSMVDVSDILPGDRLYYSVVPYPNSNTCKGCMSATEYANITPRDIIKVIAGHELFEVMAKVALKDNYIPGLAEIADPCSWKVHKDRSVIPSVYRQWFQFDNVDKIFDALLDVVGYDINRVVTQTLWDYDENRCR